MKKTYENIMIHFILLETEDVITASNPEFEGAENELPVVPFFYN